MLTHQWTGFQITRQGSILFHFDASDVLQDKRLVTREACDQALVLGCNSHQNQSL